MPFKLLAIAANTYQETIRQPIFSVLLWVAVGLLILNPALAGFSLDSGSDAKIMKDVGLSTMLLFGLLSSAFSAASVITREIESFTVLTVVSKPVSRPAFLVGKFVGVSLAMLVAFYVLALVFLMTVRHGVMETAATKYHMPVLVFSGFALGVSLLVAGFGNFTYGWNFATTLLNWVVGLGTAALAGALCFDNTFKAASPLAGLFEMQQSIYAIILGFLALTVLTAIAVMFSTRLSQVLTLLMCAFVFVMGLLSDYYFGQHLSEGPIYQLLYCVLPNFQFYWIGDAMTQEIMVPFSQVMKVAAYTALYVPAVLGLGVALFQTREVG